MICQTENLNTAVRKLCGVRHHNLGKGDATLSRFIPLVHCKIYYIDIAVMKIGANVKWE